MDRLRVAMTVEQCWHRVPGGTATSLLGTIDALAERGDVDLVGVAARHRDPAPEAFRPSIEVRQLHLPRVALYESWHAAGWPPVERATGPVDVVHATAVAVPPCRAPLVVTIHDLAFLADASHATHQGNRFFRRGIELARRRAQLVLVPSEATAEECRHAGFDESRLRVVPWGVTARAVPEQEVADTRERFGLDRPYVLFVGTIEPRKNLAGVIGAMGKIGQEGVDLVLVGPDGWNEDLGALLDRVESAGVRVHRLGFQRREALGPLYAGAAAFCFPSLREGFGLPVLEAMAHGAPVVTSVVSATAEVAGSAALLVDPLDTDEIAAALDRILADATLAADLRRRARARAAEFTWARTAELTVAAYAEVSR